MAGRTWLFVSLFVAVSNLQSQSFPAQPNRFVDTTYPTMAGSTINVAAGGDFQGALNRALSGDTIVLQAGATFSGNFTLPAKSGTGWIIIRTSTADSSLPSQGHRMTPSSSSLLPKIVTPNSSPAIQSAAGAHNYRFVAVEITVSAGVSNYGLVQLDDGNTSTLSQLPSNIIFDRVYLHGQPNDNLRRGIAMNSNSTAVIDSTISEVHESGADNQTIACWNGGGPFKITNNYLEAAGENVLFGGADPKVVNLVPSDIQILGNYFFKPAAWRTASWTVKNILELKNAQRVLIDGNVFEHNWPAAQNGYSILFTVRNQAGTAPWSVVQDITFTHNIVRHVAGAINMQGTDDLQSSQQTYRVLISNNVFDDVSDTNWGGNGNLQQVISNPLDVTVDHNTAFPTYADLVGGGTPTQRFTYRNNLEAVGRFGVAGDYHYGDPAGALTTYFPGAVFTKNALIGATCSQYPVNNFCPATTADVGFANYAGGDYHLLSTSPYKNAGTDGKDLGADIDSVNAATSGAITGVSGSTPPPPPPPPPADTTPPSVSITSPANGVTISGAISMTATASDNVGVVGVQFYLDGNTLGAEDTTAPYSVTWDSTTALNGIHALTAAARDAAGNRTTSTTVNVTVSNAAPGRSPYFGTPFTVPGTFEAENFDKGGEGVAYHDNTVGNQGGLYRLTEDVDIISPYSGGYVVNNFENGEWLEYSVNITASGTYKIEALVSSAMTGSQFHVSIDGVDKTGAVVVPNTGAWTTFQWVPKDNVSLPAGQHILRVTADVQYFNFDALRLSQVVDTTPPSVAITSPASGATVSATVAVSANASDDIGVAGVQFYANGSAIGAEDTASPYSISWNTTAVANGSYTLTAVARDAAGNHTTSAAVAVTVANPVPDTTPPSISITSPAAAATVSGSTTISATASDNVGVAGVQFYANGSAIGAEDTASPYSISWDTTAVANGAYMLTAVARDAAGNHTTSAAVAVTVANPVPDTTPPSISISSPAAAATVSGSTTISATASDNVGVAGVQFYVDSAPLGSEDTTSPYSVSWDTTRFTNGTHTLTAAARDAAGNRTTSAAVNVNVSNNTADTTPPTVSITSPASDTTMFGTVNISASASDNVGVAGVQFNVDGSPLGTEDTSAPYSVSWDTTRYTNGSHTLTATARDAAGNRVSSAPVTVNVSNVTPRSPFTGTPFAIPGQFEAEDFDKGGEGVAYHDNTAGNQGGLYRTTEDVDIISPYAGGYVINNFENAEWLEYTVNVTTSETYRIEALVSSALTNSQFHVSVDGADVTGPLVVPNTGAWTAFQWVGKSGITLAAGPHILRMTADVQYFNFDSVRVSTTTTPRSPYSGTPAAVPGQFEAEDFDKGGEGVAYHDNTPGNQGGLYRTAEDVDIISPYAGGYVVNNFENGEWLEYTINVAASAGYHIEALVSSALTNSQFHISIDGVDVTGALIAPNTGVWTTFQWVGKTGVSLTSGQHILRITTDLQYFNLDRIRLTQETAPATPAPALSVLITSPGSGATLSGTAQLIAVPNIAVAGVSFFVDGNPIGSEATAAPYTAAWNTSTVANGSHALTAIARDASGNTATSPAIQVMVANNTTSTPPPPPPSPTGLTVAITSPVSGATLSGTVQLSANASAGAVGVRFYVDGKAIGLEDNFAPFAVSWDTTTTADGSHTLTAVTRDLSGNIVTSAPVSVTVRNTGSRKRPAR